MRALTIALVLSIGLVSIGLAGGVPPTNRGPAVSAKCQRIFDGRTWAGLGVRPPRTGRSWTAPCAASGRRAVSVHQGRLRQLPADRDVEDGPVNKDHLGILFWGPRPARGLARLHQEYAGPASAWAMWDYFENMALEREVLDTRARATTRRGTRPRSSPTSTTAHPSRRGRRSRDFATPTRMRRGLSRGPIGMQRHGAGGSEYKDIFVEADPVEKRLYTVK